MFSVPISNVLGKKLENCIFQLIFPFLPLPRILPQSLIVDLPSCLNPLALGWNPPARLVKSLQCLPNLFILEGLSSKFFISLISDQFSSVTQSCPTLCNPMNRSTPGLPVHHQLPEFTQSHVHWVSDAIQPSHPLSSPSPPAPNASQHQGLFQWVNSSHEVAEVLEFQLQHQSFQWPLRTDLLQDGLVGTPCSPRDSQESSPTPQFKSINFWHLAFFTVQLSHPYLLRSC